MSLVERSTRQRTSASIRQSLRCSWEDCIGEPGGEEVGTAMLRWHYHRGSSRYSGLRWRNQLTASAIHHHPLNDGVAEGEVVRYAALQPSTPAYTPPDADTLPHSLCIIPSPSFPASFRLQHLFTSIPFPSLCVSRHSPSRTLLALLPPRSPSASSSSPPYRLLHPLSSAPSLSKTSLSVDDPPWTPSSYPLLLPRHLSPNSPSSEPSPQRHVLTHPLSLPVEAARKNSSLSSAPDFFFSCAAVALTWRERVWA